MKRTSAAPNGAKRYRQSYEQLLEIQAYLKHGIRTRADGDRYFPLLERVADELQQMERRQSLLGEILETAVQ